MPGVQESTLRKNFLCQILGSLSDGGSSVASFASRHCPKLAAAVQFGDQGCAATPQRALRKAPWVAPLDYTSHLHFIRVSKPYQEKSIKKQN
ncbi:hypothetical protein KL907_004149 [Ogataea polymorpha]|nr:hypothetical protein KL907_004149 [Ogataea polymorpha]